MFLVNSRYPRLAATLSGSLREAVHQRGHTLSRSYGVNLPSSFTRVLSRALVFSTYLPESVYGTGTNGAPPAAFLGSMGSTGSPAAEALDSHHISRITPWPFDRARDPYLLEPGIPTTGLSTLLRPCWLLRSVSSAGMLTCLPSPTPVGLGLGPD